MRRKWYKGRFGIEVLDADSEFLPRKYRVRAFDLRKFGEPSVPVVGQTTYRSPDVPSTWHVHRNSIEFIYCAAGTCEYDSRGKRYRLRPGMMFVSREGEEHRQLDCPKGYSSFYLQFRPVANAKSRWFEARCRELPRLFPCGRSVPVRFGRILSLAEDGKSGLELKIRIQAEVWSLFLDILDSAALTVERRVPPVFDEIAEQMRRNPECDYPLDGLVARCGMSKASFMAHFKTARGYSPYAYLLSCRIESAKALIRKGLSENEVVERLGFTSLQNLSRTFRNFVGTTPRKWLAEIRA